MIPVHILGTESFIHRLSPLTKLFAVVLFWATALVTFDPTLLALMICVSLIIWVFAKMNLRNLRPLLMLAFMVGVVMITFNGFAFWNGKTALFVVPILGWEFWYEGMIFGLSIVLKIFAVVTIVPLLTQTTPMPHFMAGLSTLKLPYKVVFTLGMAFRLVPLIGMSYKDITESQTLRGHDVKTMKLSKENERIRKWVSRAGLLLAALGVILFLGSRQLQWDVSPTGFIITAVVGVVVYLLSMVAAILPRLTKGYIPLFIPLILTLLRRSSDLDIAIESRGFGAPVKRSSLVDIGMTWRDYVFLVFFMGAFVGIIYLVVFGGGLRQAMITVGSGMVRGTPVATPGP